MIEKLLTVKEVASLLRLREETIRRMVKRGNLPHLLIGGRTVRFTQEMIDSYLRAYTVNGDAVKKYLRENEASGGGTSGGGKEGSGPQTGGGAS